MKQLGIEPVLLLAQIINFAVVVFVLRKFLYKPLLSMLDKRKAEIEDGIKLTEKMRLEDEKMQDKREKLLDSARKEAHAIIEEGKKQGKEEEKKIISEAHKQAADVLKKAQTQAEQTQTEMMKTARSQAVDIALEMIKRVLPSVMNEESHRKLLRDKLQKLEVASSNIH